MKWLLIFFYVGQVCAAVGSGMEGPPYFYMQSFETHQEALEAAKKLESETKWAIIYGYPEFDPSYRTFLNGQEINVKTGGSL